MANSHAAIPPKRLSPGSVGAVIVAHDPDLPVLQEVVSAVEPQVAKVILLDNGSMMPVAPRLSLGMNTSTIRLAKNLGIGAAQNRGIEETKKHRCELVLFLDQDSVPSKSMVLALIGALDLLSSKGNRIAAVGPRHIDPRHMDTRPTQEAARSHSDRTGPGGSSPGYRCANFLLSSGSLVPADVLNEVGPMDPSLFIDSTDRDWCFRALSKGYKLYRCEDSILTHKRGDHLRCIWPIPKVYEAVHKPQRLYFMMRNRVLLYQRSYVPAQWIVADIPRALGKIALSIVFGPERRSRFSFIVAGVWHGIKGRAGPYADQ
jgi:rhamnosyltransferase